MPAGAVRELTPDGKLLFTTGADKVIRSWNLDSGKEVRAFLGGEQPIRCLAISRDGTTLAAADAAGSVYQGTLVPPTFSDRGSG